MRKEDSRERKPERKGDGKVRTVVQSLRKRKGGVRMVDLSKVATEKGVGVKEGLGAWGVVTRGKRRCSD